MDFHLTEMFDAVADAVPDREAIVWGDRRVTYAQLRDRSRALANHLLGNGATVHVERADLNGWESGQDHLALYLHNGNEYLEGMLGAYAARMAPFNVNYRYVEEELVYLLNDSAATAIIYNAAFAPTLAKVLPDVPSLRVLLQVSDESGHALLPGAADYEDVLTAAPTTKPSIELSPDDLYILYTGGTTGMPKGVLWRQGDIFPAALGGRDPSGNEWASLDDLVAVARDGGAKLLPGAPFMHGAAHWLAFNAFSGGNTIVLPNETAHLDPVDVWRTVDQEAVNIMLIVGDAMARPLVDELEDSDPRAATMLLLISGGAPLSAGIKNQFLEALPSMAIVDAVGASETGQQARQITGAGTDATTGTFQPGPGMCIADEQLKALLPTDSDELGWLAQTGRIPLGYLGDEEKTRRTFPELGADRYSIPGDRARYTADGQLELHGRDSVTINSGGEKIFAEEVEAAIKRHPDVYDVVVAGRPSERWGSEVVAVVHLREGTTPSEEALKAAAESHIARYKLPKAYVFVDGIVRSPAGKADYRWARERAITAP